MKILLDPDCRKIKCPVVVRIDDSVMRFENVAQLYDTDFDLPYSVDSIDIVDGDAIEFRLVEQPIFEKAWPKGKDIGFF